MNLLLEVNIMVCTGIYLIPWSKHSGFHSASTLLSFCLNNSPVFQSHLVFQMNHLSVFSLDSVYSQLKRRACAKKLHASVLHVTISYIPPALPPFFKTPFFKYSVWMMFDTSVTALRKTRRIWFCSSSGIIAVSVWTFNLFRIYLELSNNVCVCVCVLVLLRY